MAVLITLISVAALVAPSLGGAPPVQGLPLVTPRAVPFESRSFRAAPLGNVAPVERQPVSPWSSLNRRFDNALTTRAEGIGAPGSPADLAECPGSRRKTCNENGVHRVCLQLLEGKNIITYGFEVLDAANPKLLDYFAITGKESYRYEWWSELTNNGGTSRCVGVDSTTMLIERVGCDKVNINCAATDRAFVFMKDKPSTPGLKSLAPVKECIEKKCGPVVPALGEDDAQNDSMIRLVGIMTAAAAAAVAAAMVVRRRTLPAQPETLLG